MSKYISQDLTLLPLTLLPYIDASLRKNRLHLCFDTDEYAGLL